MAKFNFKVSSTKKTQEPVKKMNKVVLKKHETTTYVGEMYTYLDENNEEHQYAGIINKQEDGKAYGKAFDVHEVKLTYHPEIAHVEPVDEYFSYVDANGNECVYKGKVEFDLERNTYIGVLRQRKINEHMIQIFEEK